MNRLEKLLDGRTEQERRTLTVGAALALPLFIYLLVWQPLLSGASESAEKVQQKQQAYEWMLGAAEQIRRLAPRGVANNAGSPQQLITRAGREQDITFNRIEPQSGGRFNVWIASCDYNACVRFLDAVISRGLLVDDMTLSRLATPGTVSLRVTLGAPE